MPTEEQEQPTLTSQDIKALDLDAPTKFLNLSLRQIHDWEARHRQFCRLTHRQPCTCSAWE